MRVNRVLSTRRASTRCPFSQRRRGIRAAKLIRTCSAIRVFSASTLTGPHARTAATTRSKVSRTAGSVPAKCRSMSPSAAQVCVWLRLAKVRPQAGHTHISVTAGRLLQVDAD
jgi:hypothetical protein